LFASGEELFDQNADFCPIFAGFSLLSSHFVAVLSPILVPDRQDRPRISMNGQICHTMDFFKPVNGGHA